jgi:vacuolar-type H+-ATPase subunit H
MAQARRPNENEQGQQSYQQSRQSGQTSSQARENYEGRIPSTINIAAVALRGLGEAYDMQMAAARLALQTQARAAVAFGWPDYSEFFRLGSGRAKRAFATSTEQLLNSAQQTSETISEVQREVGKLIECNAESIAESWQQGLEEFSIQAEESLEQMKDLARQQVEEAMQTAESLGSATRKAVRESGEQFRETVRQGAERGREMMSEQGEQVREQTERTSAAAGGAGEEQEQERSGRRSGRAA